MLQGTLYWNYLPMSVLVLGSPGERPNAYTPPTSQAQEGALSAIADFCEMLEDGSMSMASRTGPFSEQRKLQPLRFLARDFTSRGGVRVRQGEDNAARASRTSSPIWRTSWLTSEKRFSSLSLFTSRTRAISP